MNWATEENGYLLPIASLPIDISHATLNFSMTRQNDQESGNEKNRKYSPKEWYAKGLKRDQGKKSLNLGKRRVDFLKTSQPLSVGPSSQEYKGKKCICSTKYCVSCIF